jgi:MFS family permease
MVAYGKSLKNARRHGWEAAYLDYKDLKSILRELEGCLSIISSKEEAAIKERGGKNINHIHNNNCGHDNSSTNELSPLVVTNTDDNDKRPQRHHHDEEQGGGGEKGGTIGLSGFWSRSTDDSVNRRQDAPTANNAVARLKIQFFERLRYEIEKLSLFTLQRLGDLADTLGTLRFGDDEAVAKLFDKEQHILQRFSSPRFSDAGTRQEQSKDDDQLLEYLKIGVELLHVMQFVALNSVGIRKILKKYKKIVQQLDDPNYYHIGERILDHDHLQSVANSQSVAALQSSLQTALVQLYSRDRSKLVFSSAPSLLSAKTDDGDQVTPYRMLLYFRFETIMMASYKIQQTLKVVNQPFREYLSRQAMILTGSNLGELDGATDLISMLFDPDTLLTLHEMALNDLWSNWVPDYEKLLAIQADDGDIAPIPITSKISIDSQLLKMTNVAMMLLEEGEDGYEYKNISHLDGRNKQPTNREKMWGGADGVSMALNLMSTLLYTINYYIVSPTANRYATILGLDGAFGATLIGASSFAAIFAAFLYSFWYTRGSIKSALIFSTLIPFLGNLLYVLALSYDSFHLAIIARILCGFGSAEVVNRQMISGCVSFKHMTRASAYFVAFGAMGMSIGPLIAAILDDTAGRDLNIDIHLPFSPVRGIIYNHVTAPGFFMACLWFVEMICIVFLFREPDRINGSGMSGLADEDDDFLSDNDYGSPGSTALMIEKRSSMANSSYASSMESSLVSARSSTGVWEEIKTTWQLVTKNPGLPVTLFLFCFVELADEVLISSCSMVVRRYFSWHGSAAGFLIASLGALVLPSNFIVETFSHKVSERKILIVRITHDSFSCAEYMQTCR